MNRKLPSTSDLNQSGYFILIVYGRNAAVPQPTVTATDENGTVRMVVDLSLRAARAMSNDRKYARNPTAVRFLSFRKGFRTSGPFRSATQTPSRVALSSPDRVFASLSGSTGRIKARVSILSVVTRPRRCSPTNASPPPRLISLRSPVARCPLFGPKDRPRHFPVSSTASYPRPRSLLDSTILRKTRSSTF